MLKLIKYPVKENWPEILARPAFDTTYLENKVLSILNDVKENGDKAVYKYNRQFDKTNIENLLVSRDEISEAVEVVSVKLKHAIQVAKCNIEKFHLAQQEEVEFIETMPGIKCWRKSVAIQKVGLYIPGGTAPLFSTVLMLGVPSKLAGCKEIILCSPPNDEGKINNVILYTAQLVGITKIYKVGGAQAIAAMAYGTQTIPKTYKVFGPGNQYVTCAKQLINKQGIAIDMPAGPSEIAVLADETCVPEFVAADLLSQAEHGSDSHVILVSTDEKIIESIQYELSKQIDVLPRKEIAAKALQNSKAILVHSKIEGIDLLNEYAPEHLIISCSNCDELAEQVVNAGSVFIGNYSCESAGDYASGTNHTLPTNGNAKAYSGVSLDSFVKKISYQKITCQGLHNIGNAIEVMAEAEGLYAHKNAVAIRMNK